MNKYNIFKIAKGLSEFKLPIKRLSLIFYSLLTGLLTGGIIVLYRVSLDNIVVVRNSFLTNFTISKILLIIFVFIIIASIMQVLLNHFPLISGSGIPQVYGLLQKKIKFNWLFELITKFINGVLAISAGFSLGREGPSIHLGSLVGVGINKNIKDKELYEKYILTSGTSAGLAAAFNAPLSGVMFAIEELHKFISPMLIICILIASSSASLVTHLFLGNELVFNIFRYLGTVELTWSTFLINLILIFILNILVLLLSLVFNFLLIKLKNIYESIKISNFIKMSIAVLGALLVVIFFPEITGGGHHLIEHLFIEEYTLKFIIALLVGKLIFTTLSYSTGASGGIFLPMLVIGGLLGKLFGLVLVKFFGFDPFYEHLYMLLAMSAFFTSVVKAPITGIILILEMTGNFSNLFLLTIASGFSYVLTEIFRLESIYELLYEGLIKKLGIKDDSHFHKGEMVIHKIVIVENSTLVNKKIKDIELPSNLLIIGIERNGKEFIPQGNTILKASDALIIFTDEQTANTNIHIISKLAKVDRMDD